MAINLAEKYAKKVDEKIQIDAYTGKNLNTDYEFTGVETVKIYTIDTVDLNEYTRNGLSRYGTPEELGDSVQEMSVKQDWAFTYTIDKGNDKQQLNIKGAASTLKRQIAEKVVPFLDKYRFAIFAQNVQEGMSDATALTKTNVYEKFLDGTSKLAEKGISEGLVSYWTPAAFNKIKLDSSFVKGGDMSQKMLLKGQVGEVDGVAVVVVAGKRLPGGIDFMITQNKAMVSPVVLRDYKIHQDPPGINGNLVEGRILFDAFILGSRKDAIYVQGTRTSDMTMKLGAGYTVTAAGANLYKEEKAYYKVANAEITPAAIGSTFKADGYTAMNSIKDVVTGTSTNKYAEIVIVDREGKVRDANVVELKSTAA